MSFINLNDQGTVYAPGYFLAHEECVRETREMAQNSTLVQTAADGAKYIPMGTAYPTNDGNAIGIVYEDVDVTTGNMPGSVVTKGVVIEDRLAITGASYDAVTLKDLVSPKAQGWQERSGSSPNYTYADSTDTTVNTSKTYYLPDTDHTAVSDYAAVLNPKTAGWYERSGSSPNYVYTLSTDTEGDKTKTYYEKSDVRLASAAKSALEGLGFTFVTEPAVTRPY
jgi:hypothetical protein